MIFSGTLVNKNASSQPSAKTNIGKKPPVKQGEGEGEMHASIHLLSIFSSFFLYRLRQRAYKRKHETQRARRTKPARSRRLFNARAAALPGTRSGRATTPYLSLGTVGWQGMIARPKRAMF